MQQATEPAGQYVVPAGGGQITSWSTNAEGATAGTPLTFLALRPGVPGSYTVVGSDSETLPAGGIATFNIAKPIAVNAGDVIGLYSTTTTAFCFFTGGSSAADVVSAGPAGAPTPGATYTTKESGPTDLVNVSANLVQSQDVVLAGAATPATMVAGGASSYLFTVTNSGPAANPINFADAVPAGLTILAASAGSGNCAIAGQTVTCTIPNLAVGASAQVSILVTASKLGIYTDTATISSTLPDPNSANNTVGATLHVARALSCKLVNLKGTPLAVAKTVISALGCKVGKVTKKASSGVTKGFVISTSPGSGVTKPVETAVKIVISSGPPKHKKKH
ncbi:MAG TPA: PASTA domain-containing protein [Solirubrobacteraceae bacterium]